MQKHVQKEGWFFAGSGACPTHSGPAAQARPPHPRVHVPPKWAKVGHGVQVGHRRSSDSWWTRRSPKSPEATTKALPPSVWARHRRRGGGEGGRWAEGGEEDGDRASGARYTGRPGPHARSAGHLAVRVARLRQCGGRWFAQARKGRQGNETVPQHAAGLSAAATAPRGRAGRTSSPRCAAAAAPRSPSSTCRRTCRRPSPQALPTTRSCANESSEFESEMVARTRVAEVGHALRRAVVLA